MFHEHILEYIWDTDDLIDDETFQAAWGHAKSRYLDKGTPMESLLYRFGMACAQLGLETGYRYGQNPQLLIVKDGGQSE